MYHAICNYTMMTVIMALSLWSQENNGGSVSANKIPLAGTLEGLAVTRI